MIMVVCWCPLSCCHLWLHRSLTAATLFLGDDFGHLVVVVVLLLLFFGDNSRLIHLAPILLLLWSWTGYNKFVIILLSTVVNGSELSFAAVVPAQSLHIECSTSISLLFILVYLWGRIHHFPDFNASPFGEFTLSC